jgi:hypothetical protein
MPSTATSRARSTRESALCLLLTTSIALLMASPPGSAGPRDPLYQWSDAAGAVRYTTDLERIPADRRDAAVVVAAEHDRGRAAQPASQPAAPTESIASPPVEPPPDAAPALPPVEAKPPAAPVSDEVAAIDTQIAELERNIAADETALGEYISDPERAARQRESGEVAAIAERLPRLQNELRELRKQREAAIAPDGP